MNNKLIGNKNNIVFYTDEEGNTNIEVILQDEDVWLNVQAIAELFDVNDKAIYKHITNIYEQEELEENSTFSILETIGKNGHKYKTKYYNLDMIISIGYRVNAEKENMGLTTWKEAPDGMIYKYDVTIAKNYLNEGELKKLNNLTNFFLDYAETMAEENQIMTMKDWINETDNLLKFRKKEILKDSGKISHRQAVKKAEKEYEKFRVKQDMQYISSMDEMYQKYLKENS